MTGREIMKEIMDSRGISNAELAQRLGLSNAAMWDRLNTKKGKSISCANLSEAVAAMGYKLVVVPQDTPVPEAGYLVE